MRTRSALFRHAIVLGFCLLFTTAWAQAPEPEVQTDTAAEAAEAPAETEAPAAAKVRAELPPFDAEAAVEAYLARQSPEEKELSDAYFEGGYWLQLWGLLYALGVAWLFLGTGLSRRMRSLAERISRFRPVQTILYGIQYLFLVSVLTFPLTVYQGFFREHQYGLATQAFGPWFGEQLIGLAVTLVLIPLLLVPLYGVFRKAPRTWWIWGAGIMVLFLMFTLLIAPVFIDPLFNTYEPLEEGSLKDSILSLARASGIEADDVLRFDASRQTTRVSANVSGFLGTMAIRLNDNLLNRCSTSEIRAVMAHEIGHYALNHIYEAIIVFGLVLVAAFAFIRWSFERLVARWGEGWGVAGIGDLAGLPLLLALLATFFFLATPVNNNIIRSNEVEADLYGLQSAREPEGFAEVALKLGEYRKLQPGPFEEWFFFDHPSGRSRISMAMRWKAEQLAAAEREASPSPETLEPAPADASILREAVLDQRF